MKLKNKVIPLLVVIGLLLILLRKLSVVSRMVIPIWDGCVYLTNARDLFALRPLYEHFRPPFLSFIIGVIWVIIGKEDYYLITRFIHPIFTICAGLVFYFIVQKERGATFAMLATFVFMLNGIVLFWSDHLLTHGLTVFFLLLGAYLLTKEKHGCWYLGGLFLALAILSRYASVIIVLAILPVIAFRKGIIVLQKEAIVLPKEKLILLLYACIGALTSFTPWYIWNMMVYGNIRHILRRPGPAGGTLSFTPSLSYVWNSLAIFNTVIILVFLSLVQRSTYKDERNHLWLSWFISSFVFWSAVSGGFTSILAAYRFTFEWMPAVGYVSIIPLERVWRAKDKVKPKINSSIVRLFVTGLLIVLLSYGVASSCIGYYKEPRPHTFYSDDSFFEITNYLKENTREDDIIVTNGLAPIIAYFTGRYTTMSWTAKDVNEWKSFIKDVKGTVAVIFVRENGLYSEANITRYEFLEFKTIIRTKYYQPAYIFTINYNGW